MGPNRNSRWSKSGLRVTLSYLLQYFFLFTCFVVVENFVFLPHQNHRNCHHFAVAIVNLTSSFNFSNFIFFSLRISTEQICTSSTWCNHKLDILILGWSWIIIFVFVSLSISEAENSNIFFSKTTCIMFCYIAMTVEMFNFWLLKKKNYILIRNKRLLPPDSRQHFYVDSCGMNYILCAYLYISSLIWSL